MQGDEDSCELVSVVVSQLDFIQIPSQCGVELQVATPLEKHDVLNKALSLVSGRAKGNGLQFHRQATVLTGILAFLCLS